MRHRRSIDRVLSFGIALDRAAHTPSGQTIEDPTRTMKFPDRTFVSRALPNLSQRFVLTGIVGLCTALMVPALADADENPWQLLEAMRTDLRTNGPLTAHFEQTFVPAGFDSGDREGGQLSLWLPNCLRWSYQEGRSFLVCDGTVHQWNEGEPAGRVFVVDPSEEAGLDLLLLETATLRERYVASSQAIEGNRWAIDLSMPPGKGSYRARVTLEGESKRVVAFEYVDDEGNRTTFTIDDYKTVGHTALFRPPVGLEWSED